MPVLRCPVAPTFYTFHMTGVLVVVAALVSWGLALWSLLAVVRVPRYLFWKPAIAATDWGHWLVGPALGVVGAGLLMGQVFWVGVPALVAATVFASPSVRAMFLAGRVRDELDRVFPLSSNGSTGISRPSPFMVSDLPTFRFLKYSRSVRSIARWPEPN